MPGTRVKHIRLAKCFKIMLMSVCSLIKQWHFRLAEGGPSVAEFLNILSILLCEEVNVTSSSSCWFIAPWPQIPGLSRLCSRVITHQPGRLLIAPAELLEDHIVLPYVVQQMPPVVLALGTPSRWLFLKSMRCFDTLVAQGPFPPWAQWQELLLGFAFVGSAPWFSFTRLSKKKMLSSTPSREGRMFNSGWKDCSKICLNPGLSHLRRLCVQAGPSIRCTGNSQSKLKILKGWAYNSVHFEFQDFVEGEGREVTTNVISSRSALL